MGNAGASPFRLAQSEDAHVLRADFAAQFVSVYGNVYSFDQLENAAVPMVVRFAGREMPVSA